MIFNLKVKTVKTVSQFGSNSAVVQFIKMEKGLNRRFPELESRTQVKLRPYQKKK